jgi:hypothetical protein
MNASPLATLVLRFLAPLFVATQLVATDALADAPLFESAQRSYGTGLTTGAQGYYPQGNVLADLDGDGDLDCVVAQVGNFITPKFTLLKNRGDGSFEPPVFVAISGESADVVAGDWDGDNDIDLAFCVGGYGTGGQSVAVFVNNGSGSFGAQQTFACGRGPTGLVAFDADLDGDLDLATANWYWNEADVSVLYNNGAGSFATRVDFAVPGLQLFKIDAGDLDADGWPDLAASVRGGMPAFVVLMNNGAGGFGAPTSHAAAASGVNDVPGLALADVDLDGDKDVLYSGGANIGLFGSIALYRNNGAGSLGAPESFAVNVGRAGDFAVADVTLDGRPDILCVGYSNKYGYSVLPSTPTGFGASFTLRAGESARSISTGDLDGDLDLDVVVANSGSLTVTVHLNENGALALPAKATMGSFANGVASADIDHDGDIDLVATDTRIWSFFNDGQGGLSPSFQNANVGALKHPQLADVDGDGWADLLVVTNVVLYARSEGAVAPGFFGPLTPLSNSMGSVSNFDLADFDGDGDLDLCATVVASNADRVVVVKNLGAFTFGAPTFLSASNVTGGSTIVAADFDNDGDADIVYGNGQAVAWRNQGAAGFSGPVLSNAAGGFVRMTEGDFDGDGVLDLAGVNYEYNGMGENLVVLRGLGNLGFASPQVYYGMFSLELGGTTAVATVDADGDGALDILCGDYGGDDVVLFQNAGNGSFRPPVGYGVDGVVTSMHVADLDGDAVADVAMTIGTEPPIGGAVSVLLGKGSAPAVQTYCTAGTSTNGCVAQMSATGAASLGASSGFTLAFSGADALRQGLIFYGVNGRSAFAWGTSTSFLCVKAPTQRLAIGSTGGTFGQCDGGIAVDWLAFLAAAPGALGQPFQAGDVVDAQGWYRDPPSPKTTQLSDGIEFVVLP